MNTGHIEQQRNLLQTIAIEISDVEQIAFGSSMDPESKQRLLGEKLCQIRQAAMAGINDQDIATVILNGYRVDCLDSLLGLLNLSNSTVDEMEEGGKIEPTDMQLQLLAMAARNFGNRFEKYMQLKTDVIQGEVANG
jgi:hypothetical protein